MADSKERTLVLLKPDAVQRGLVGTIVSRLEGRGLTIAAMKLVHMDRGMASRHYEAHVERPFFPGLVDFITSGPLVAMVLQGPRAVEMVRNTMGATNPLESAPGTIRGDLATDIGATWSMDRTPWTRRRGRSRCSSRSLRSWTTLGPWTRGS